MSLRAKRARLVVRTRRLSWCVGVSRRTIRLVHGVVVVSEPFNALLLTGSIRRLGVVVGGECRRFFRRLVGNPSARERAAGHLESFRDKRIAVRCRSLAVVERSGAGRLGAASTTRSRLGVLSAGVRRRNFRSVLSDLSVHSGLMLLAFGDRSSALLSTLSADNGGHGVIS